MKTFYLFTWFRQRFVDVCDGKVARGGMTVMRDISSVVGGCRREFGSEEQIVNKIQDIVWDEVFQRYFLHPNVIFKLPRIYLELPLSSCPLPGYPNSLLPSQSTLSYKVFVLVFFLSCSRKPSLKFP